MSTTEGHDHVKIALRYDTMIMLSCLDARMPALAERSRAGPLTSCLSIQQTVLHKQSLLFLLLAICEVVTTSE